MFASLRARLRALVSRQSADAELDEELRYHLDRETERNVATGMSLHAARDAARRAFGNPTVHAERARDTARWRWADELAQDLSYAIRTFRRAPTFVLGVVCTIGLGLGLLTTAFTLFDAYVLRPLSVREPGLLYESNEGLTWPQYRRLDAGNRVFTDVIGSQQLFARVRGRSMFGELVTGNYFDVLGVSPALGRTLIADDASVPSAGRAIVLSYDAWRSTFGGDSSVIGNTLLVDGISMRIVGVARRGFNGLGPVPMRFWAPITMHALSDSSFVRLTGHIRPELTEQRAAAELRNWMMANATDPDRSQNLRLTLTPMGTAVPIDQGVVVVFAPVAAAFVLVMLIACANVANMMLARGVARQREIGIRLALGAGRARLIRQLLTEAIVLAVPSAAMAFVVSRITVRAGSWALFATMPEFLVNRFHMQPLQADWRIALFMTAVAVGAALAFGALPAVQATRPSVVRATRGDFDAPVRKSTLRAMLLVVQIGVSVLLLVCAGILLRGSQRLSRVDARIRTNNIVEIAMRDTILPQVLRRLYEEATVRNVASAKNSPLDGAFGFVLAGADSASAQPIHSNKVSSAYFSLLRLPLVRGRTFTADEARARAPVVVISEAAAQAFWRGADPVGRTVVIADFGMRGLDARRRATVIGVVRNAYPGFIGHIRDWSVVYVPQPIDARSSTLLVDVTGDEHAARIRLDTAIASVDSGAVTEIHTLDDALDLGAYSYRLFDGISWIVGAVALLITLTGVYGVLSYVVAQRTRELGIRAALGAQPGALVTLVMRDVRRVTIVGLLAGIGLALIVSRLFAAVLVSVEVYDALGYAIGIGAVLLSCAVAAYVPARRASSVDPVDALRAD